MIEIDTCSGWSPVTEQKGGDGDVDATTDERNRWWRGRRRGGDGDVEGPMVERRRLEAMNVFWIDFRAKIIMSILVILHK